MKKVLIVSPGGLPIPAVKGGAVETLIEYLINENELESNFIFTVVSCENNDARIKSCNYNNTNFIYIRINAIFNNITKKICRGLNRIFNVNIPLNLIYYHSIFNQIKEHQYDFILVENLSDFVCFLVNRKIRSRIVLHLHNDYLNNQVSNAKKIIENCHTILTVSEFIRSRVLTIGLDYSNKVKILKNCTDTVLFDRNRYFDFRKWYRSNYSIERDDIVIMFSGRIHQTKGIKELLLAYEKLNCSNAKLLVIGSSWYGNNHVTKFSKEINDLSNNYKKNIIFTGYIPFEEVPKFHSVADIAVVPSIWEEPAGLVVIEAMSSGLPLITTNTGGIPEYVSKESAVLIDIGDSFIDNLVMSLQDLIENDHKRYLLSQNARIFAGKFNKKNYFSDFSNFMSVENE